MSDTHESTTQETSTTGATPRDLPLTAYETSGQFNGMLVRPPHARPWMDRTRAGFAYRCLPLVIANQFGWEILNPFDIQAFWTGSPEKDGVVVQYLGEPVCKLAVGHFGYGILTFMIPFLFRTPPEYNLWCKGPANRPKDGISPLEGVIETDWSAATFTMNWQFTRRNHFVTFARGEPIAQIVPYPRGLVERFDPVQRPLDDDPQLKADYLQWNENRQAFISALNNKEDEAVERKWQREYFQGQLPDGDRFAQHQTKLPTAEFRRATSNEADAE